MWQPWMAGELPQGGIGGWVEELMLAETFYFCYCYDIFNILFQMYFFKKY